MTVKSVSSTNGVVNLNSQGSILRGVPDSGPNITSTRIILGAGQGSIGTTASPLEIETRGAAGALNVICGGDIAVTEGSFSSGAAPTQSLFVDQILSHTGNIQITVLDATADGQDLFVDENRSVQATVGSVTLNAGDNSMIASTGIIRAGTRATIRSDFGDNVQESPNLPATVWILGRVFAPAFSIEGSDDADEFSLTRLPFGTITTLSPGAGDDFVQIGSNAVPTIGTTPRSNSGGLLNGVQASITVNTGSGDDSIVLDDSADTIANAGSFYGDDGDRFRYDQRRLDLFRSRSRQPGSESRHERR